MSSTPPSPSWRPAPPAPPGPARPSGWRFRPASSRPRRAVRLGGAVLLLLLAAGALVQLLLWLAPPAPACLVLIGAGYEDNLAYPHNAQGREATSRLARLAQGSGSWSPLFPRSGKLNLAQGPIELRRGTDWRRALGGFKEPTVLVYLALHGGADSRGAYLLPQDGSAEEEDRLRLEDVLDQLAQLPARQNKVLLLDATRMTANWPLGMLHNDFARALDELDGKIVAVPNLIVVSASGPDQRSWSAGRTSAFARHVVEGLQGKADRNGDGRTDAWELFCHVRDGVEGWARAHRGATQVPVLLPKADGQRRARAINLTFRTAPPEASEAEESDSLAEARSAWQRYEQLRKQAPAAIAYAPHEWRVWEALLVRHEELLWAGAAQAAANVRAQAAEVEGKLKAELALPLESSHLSLSMPVVRGETKLDVGANFPPLTALLDAPPGQRGPTWDRLKAEGGASLRRQLLEALLARVARDQGLDLGAAADLARFLDDPLQQPRPAEAHFLVMLHRDLPRPVPGNLANLVRQALSVRREAERAAVGAREGGCSYSERVRPWLQKTVEEADAERQRGQDLLLAWGPDEGRKASASLDKAEGLYRQARERAGGAGAAFAARDRALAELPSFARWLGELPPDRETALVKRFEEVAEAVRRLSRSLELAPPSPSALAPAELARLTGEVERGLLDLRSRLDAYARTCESLPAHAWAEVEAVLGVPFLEHELRMRLLQRRRRLALREALGEAAPAASADRHEAEQVKLRAARQGRLALSALGKETFDGPAGGRENWEQVSHRVRTFVLDEHWWRSLGRAGEEVGQRWRRLPRDVEREARAARDEGPAQAKARLGPADVLTRRLGAAACQALTDPPPRSYRRLLLRDLLVWQARRALEDHWAGEDARSPYYQAAGLRFLRDAESLAQARGGEAEVAELRRRLKSATGPALDATPARHLTAGERLAVEVAARGGAGIAAVWGEAGAGLEIAPAKARERRALRLAAPGERLVLTVTSPSLALAEGAPPDVPVAEETKVAWRGLYRGRRLEGQTPISLHPLAESIFLERPAPRTAGVVMRAGPGLLEKRGTARGALALVLDCSGSMGPPPGEEGADKSRFRQVTRALRTVLQKVPRGTTLSVWAFGQAMGPDNTVKDAERTIRRLQAPTSWMQTDREVADLVRAVEELTPWNESPIVRAMLAASEDLRAVEGPKALVVLTDGEDNRFMQDKVGNPDGESIPEALKRHFEGSGIIVHVVGFQAGEEAEKQFSVVSELKPAGAYLRAERVEELIGTLERAIRPRLRYRLVREDARSPLDRSGPTLEVVADGESVAPARTRPGSYGLRPIAGWPLSQKVALGGGDVLLLELSGEGRPGLKRSLFAREPENRFRPKRKGGAWHLTLLQNQRLGKGGLQMLVALEKAPALLETEVRQVRPGATWFELEAPGSSAPFALRWGGVPGYPAPAWGLDVPRWPLRAGTDSPAPPVVRVWWSATAPEPAASLSAAAVMRARTRPVPAVAGDEKVSVDSVRVERRKVRAGPRDDSPPEERWCLVVRLSHAVGRPFLARPEGLPAPEGQEHRFYATAGKYVGAFWFGGLDAEDRMSALLGELGGLQLVSVSAMKEEARERGHVVEFGGLSAPAPAPPRPQPLVATDVGP